MTDRIAIRLGPLAPLVAPLLLAQVEPRLGVSVDAIAPIAGIRGVRAPLLVIAGELDRHTPLDESRELFEAASGPKTLWIVPGAAHRDFHRFAPVEYERRVLEFLSRALRASPQREASSRKRSSSTKRRGTLSLSAVITSDSSTRTAAAAYAPETQKVDGCTYRPCTWASGKSSW